MVAVGSRGSYALDGGATPTPQAPHVPTRRTSQIRRGCLDRVSVVVILTTMVVTVFRSIRAPAASRAIFRPDSSIEPHRRAVQRPLPSAHNGCRASGLRVERIHRGSTGACTGWPAIRAHPMHGAEAVSRAAQP